MSLIAFCSASGAPGTTTTCLAALWSWPHAVPGRRALLIDADPSGSPLLPAFVEAGLPTGGGLLGVAARRTAGPAELLEEAVALGAGQTPLILTGVFEPSQATALGRVWPVVVDAARDADTAGLDVVVDAGRLGHRDEPAPVLKAADAVVLVLRASLPQVAAARAALRTLSELRGAVGNVAVAVVGRPDPYSATQVGRALQVDVLPVLPEDPRTVRALWSMTAFSGRFGRTPLARAAGDLSSAVVTRARHLTSAGAVSAP